MISKLILIRKSSFIFIQFHILFIVTSGPSIDIRYIFIVFTDLPTQLLCGMN